METTLAFERGQREVLEHIATGMTLPVLLEDIVRLIERQAEQMLCSILLVDRERATVRHGAAPNLPKEFVAAIDGSHIGPRAGSCGTAAYFGRRVIVEDIATHDYWTDYRQFALPFGLRACWSSPIFSSGGEVLGTFAMYYRDARAPTEAELGWVERATAIAAIAIMRDRAEQALRESEQRARTSLEQVREQAALIDHAKDAILVRDVDGTIRFWSRGAERIYGWSSAEAMGRRAAELTRADPELFARANQRACETGAWTGELTQRTKAGERVMVEASWTLLRDAAGAPHAVLAINTDVTEQRRLEAQVLRAQRMEGLGTLAGGIAHDFNNILAAVSANVSLGLQDLAPNHPAREAMVEIGKASARAAELVRRILTFTHQEAPKRRPIALAPIVDEVAKLLRATLTIGIELRVRIDPSAPQVFADPTQIHQVVMNLCTNALQAMSSRGGVLEVTVERAIVSRPLATATADLAAGVYARMIVSDTGTGMDEATLEHIFDPFFTTKKPGNGTGLGLALVHGVMKNHAGGLVVRSAPGRGTAFQLYLQPAEAPVRETSDAAPPRLEPERGGGQVILVVDDEAAIVRVTTQLLERVGYRASGEVDPVRALQTFKADPRRFDAAVLDLSMPSLSGPDLARELLRIRPELPIVMTSGRIAPEDAGALYAIGVREVLMKPSSIHDLSAALERHLGRRS
jgi:PAS domain S-box-containing protein